MVNTANFFSNQYIFNYYYYSRTNIFDVIFELAELFFELNIDAEQFGIKGEESGIAKLMLFIMFIWCLYVV